MSLPLMPGSEPIPEIKPAPTINIPRAEVDNRLRGTESGALSGCGCEACQRLRKQDQEARRAVPLPVFSWDEAIPAFAPLPDVIQGRYTLDPGANASMAGEARWLRPSTGELFTDAACQERCNSSMTPRASRGLMVWEAVSVNQNAGRIRGRYDFTHSLRPQDGMHGQVRWREPGTLEVFDEAGRRQWTFVEQHDDGSLSDRSGRHRVPTEV